jgi:hypothetical protein
MVSPAELSLSAGLYVTTAVYASIAYDVAG